MSPAGNPIVKHPRLAYGFIAVLGISFLGIGLAVSMLFQFTQWAGLVVVFGFLPAGTALITVGFSGIERQRAHHSRVIYGMLAVLGIICLTLFLVINYLDSVDAISFLEPMYPSQLWRYPMQLGYFAFHSILIGGIVFVTVGMLGIGSKYFANQRTLLTLLLLLIPSLAFVTMYWASVEITVNAPMFPMRSEITQVTIVGTNPLVLYLDVKAITCRDSRIEGALIFDSYDQRVAEAYPERKWTVYGNFQGMTWTVLPGGSETTLTVNFNCTLPPGNYTVRLTAWEENHGSTHFAIP